MSKLKLSKYNDGVVFIYREKERMTDFSAKKNVSILEDMDFVAKLDFGESSIRQQDLDFAEQNDFSLEYKIRTRYVNSIDNKCKAVINNYLYDVSHVDKNREEMWIYLEGIKALGDNTNDT